MQININMLNGKLIYKLICKFCKRNQKSSYNKPNYPMADQSDNKLVDSAQYQQSGKGKIRWRCYTLHLISI